LVEQEKEGWVFPMSPRPSWEQLAERASNETDPEKLMNIVDELNLILEKREQTYRSASQASAMPERDAA
jgi:hypothetical protein